jgi:hypothetical protein
MEPSEPQEMSLAEQIVLEPKPFLSDEERIYDMRDAMEKAFNNVAYMESDENADPDPYGYAQELEQNSGVDILPVKWKSKPDEDKWVRRNRARARKAAVARLYLMGYSTAEIASQVEVSEPAVIRDIKVISWEWQKSYLQDYEALAAKDLARLDDMFNRLAIGIQMGDIKSIRTGVEIIRERSNILGYNKGVQIDIEQHVRQIASASGMDPEEAVALAQRISVRYNG